MDSGRLRIERAGSGELILTGELDQLGAPLLRDALQHEQDQQLLVVDLQRVNVVQAAGVAVLDEEARRRPMTVVARAGSATALVLSVCGIGYLARLELRPGPASTARAARRGNTGQPHPSSE